jgi:hypothetical protein
MSTPYNNEERRFALRMSLRLPIVISGRAEDGSAWSEPTETDDISTSGALFHLNQKVSRANGCTFARTGPTARRSKRRRSWSELRPAIYGTARVGVQIANPPKTGCGCSCRGLPTSNRQPLNPEGPPSSNLKTSSGSLLMPETYETLLLEKRERRCHHHHVISPDKRNASKHQDT